MRDPSPLPPEPPPRPATEGPAAHARPAAHGPTSSGTAKAGTATFGPATYGDAFADVYDHWYADRWDPDAAIAGLAALAGRQRGAAARPRLVVELGVGTGRLALGLAHHGVRVVGLDASTVMLERLGSNDGTRSVEAVAADMVGLPLRSRSTSLVYASHNTFFSLASAGAQRRCLAEVARVLAPDGLVVLDLFVPGDDPPGRDRRADLARIDHDAVVLTVTDRNPESRVVTGQHVEFGPAGVRLRPWRIRYSSPEELDAWAAESGLELRSRHCDWHGTAFTDEAVRHVSVWGVRR